MADSIGDVARKMGAAVGNLEGTLKIAAGMAAEDAVKIAKTDHDYKDKTGLLTNSIVVDGVYGAFKSNDLHAIIGAGADYALYVEKGTKPHKIKPKHRKKLRWAIEGGFMFAKEVQHPGTQGTRFLENAADAVTPKLAQEYIPDAVELAFVQAGFERGD